MEVFIIYIKVTGEINWCGRVDRNETPDGATKFEQITKALLDKPEIDVLYLPNQILPDKNLKQVVEGELVDRLPSFKTEDEIAQDEKDAEEASNPLSNVTYEQAETWIENNVTDLASAKVALKKIVKLILLRT